MSMQQVNLYRPELRPKKEWLTAEALVVCTIFYVVVMVISLKVFENNVKGEELQALMAEEAKVQSEGRLAKYRNMSKSFNVAQIDDEILQLKRQVNIRQQVGQIIQGQNLGNELGFSGNLEALAKESLESIALTQIRLSRGGAFIELKGDTRAPEDVPLYVENLQEQKSFSNIQFGALSLGQRSAVQGHEFSLGFESVYQVATDKGL